MRKPPCLYHPNVQINHRLIPFFTAGLVENIMGKTNNAVKIYQLNYIVGFAISAILFLVANKLFPPPGTDISEPFETWEGPGAIEGLEGGGSDSGSGIVTPTKGAVITNEKGATEVSVRDNDPE
jgi:hypothetical protein